MTSRLHGRERGGADVRDVPASWPSTRQWAAEGHVSRFVRDTVTTPSGDTMVREYLTHPGAVAVIALDEFDRVAVVTQYRHPTGYVFVEPPAGLLDKPLEDPLAAARRELAEEAGLAADDWRILLDVFTSPGCNEESIRIFLARRLTATQRPDGFVLEHEEAEMELAWVPLLDLVDAAYAGRVQSPTLNFGILSLYAARLGGRMDALRDPHEPWPARTVKVAIDAERG